MHRLLLPLTSALLLSALLAAPAAAAGPPCNPCVGVRTDAPRSVAAALEAEPRLAAEERLYVVWPVELDGSADATLFETVRRAGGTPWAVTRFRTPRPVLEHLDELEGELAELARLARTAGPGAHFQVRWTPRTGGEPEATGHAFLIKRAAVTVAGAEAEAPLLAGPLASRPAELEALYAEDVAAYLDGVTLAPSEGLGAAVETLAELDAGKPVVLDAVDLPAPPRRALIEAAEAARRGIAVTLFETTEPTATQLAPLKVVAREFAGDLSHAPSLEIEGAERSWAFVRGEDLALRVIAELDPAASEAQLFLADPQLKSPRRIDLASGEAGLVYGAARRRGVLEIPLAEPAGVVLVRVERMTATELDGVAERLEVAGERRMPVEEILRRLQAFEDAQARRLDHYRATNTLQLRFLFGAGAASIEASYRGPFFFERNRGFDWVWDTFYVDGVRWKGEKIPQLPLVQPERAAALPVEIHLSKEYRYRLRGTDAVEGRDCWVIDFEPLGVEPGRSLYQGTVWVDREVYARVKSRSVQVGLEGDVISSDETTFFSPLDRHGEPAPWSKESFVLPTRVVGQQLFSILSSTVPVETETRLSDVVINGEEFAERRRAAHRSEATMVRDTEEGLRYLVKDDSGERVVQEEPDTSRLFLAGGLFYDESVDFPIPVAGLNYLTLDWRGTGTQANILFGGAILTASLAQPSLFGSRWDAGVSAFGFFVDRGDELFRGGREVPAEEVESRTGQISLSLGRPLGNFTKLDLDYRLRYDTYGRAEETAEQFVVPTDTLTHTVRSRLSYNRGGYRLRLQGSFNHRDDWELWGLPGNDEFDPDQQEFVRWQANFAKTWWLPKFTKLGLEAEHLDGADLDRFSRYDFGIFGDSSVGGYPSGLVRADEADGVHLNWGQNLGELFRWEIEADAVAATSRSQGLEDEILAGVGLEGTITLPWQTLVNFELGKAVAGPGDGIAVRIVFLRLFPEGKGLFGWGGGEEEPEEGETQPER